MKHNTGKRRPLHFRKPRQRAALPVSLLVLAAIVVIFWLIPPLRLDTESVLPHNIILPTATPRTPTPRPTDVHGGRIVFTCTRGDYNQICIINADGTGYRQLTSDERNSYYPAFLPQGGAVVYASNHGGNIFDLDLLILSNSQRIQLTHDIGNAYSPSFSPDGQQIAFVNRAADGPASIWVMGRAGEDSKLLYAGASAIVAAKWSPRGDTIAFAMAVGETYTYQVYLLDVAHPDQPPRTISKGMTAVGGSLDWSPSGENLLIYAGPVGDREIYRLDIATGVATQLTFGGNNAAAAYSPDGQWIVYNSTRNNDQADLYIMRFDGHTTRQLTDNPEPDWQPQWEP
jgi:TolB protein